MINQILKEQKKLMFRKNIIFKRQFIVNADFVVGREIKNSKNSTKLKSCNERRIYSVKIRLSYSPNW